MEAWGALSTPLKDAGDGHLDRLAYYSQSVVDVSSVEDFGGVRRSRSA
jgi:hypothetical protein